MAAELPDVRLICPDLPGHGGAPDWDSSQDFQDQALDLVLAELPDRPVDVIGHSFGGTLGLRLAVDHPDRVASLALVEPVMFAAAAPVARAANEANMSPFAAALDRGDPAAAAASFHGMWGAGAWADLSDRARTYITARIHLIRATEPAILRDLHDVLPRLPRDLPVRILTCRSPPAIVAAIRDGLCARMPQAQTGEIGAGHMIPLEDPGPLAETLRSFWGT